MFTRWLYKYTSIAPFHVLSNGIFLNMTSCKLRRGKSVKNDIPEIFRKISVILSVACLIESSHYPLHGYLVPDEKNDLC